jgi:uncharacterized protein (DUF2141 family)
MNRSTFPLALILCLAGCFNGTGPSRADPAPSLATSVPATQPMATLTIRVTDLRNHNGQLLFAVFKSPDGFPKEKSKSVDWQVKPIDANSVVFTASLPPGKYAASVLHDENKNDKMDMNFLGIPEEGYGVTNNPKPAYRQARFDEALFNLPPGGAALTISIQYF